jgi:hypothetical protein
MPNIDAPIHSLRLDLGGSSGRTICRATILGKPAVVNGSPRSEVKTKGDLGSLLYLEAPEHAQLAPRDRMDRGRPVLHAQHMQLATAASAESAPSAPGVATRWRRRRRNHSRLWRVGHRISLSALHSDDPTGWTAARLRTRLAEPLPILGPPCWAFFQPSSTQGGPSAADRLTSSIVALLPIALCGRSSL